MSSKHSGATASVIGIDIGKNSFHIIGQDQRGAIVAAEVVARAGGGAARYLAAVLDRD